MTAVLEAWDRKETPPQGCVVSEHATLFKLQRHKVSYAPPNQPTIWIRREGFAYEAFTEMTRTPEERAAAQANQVERYIISKLEAGEYHTRRSLDDQCEHMGLTRRQIRAAVSTLEAQGRIYDAELPAEKKQGSRQTYLCPADHCAGSEK